MNKSLLRIISIVIICVTLLQAFNYINHYSVRMKLDSMVLQHHTTSPDGNNNILGILRNSGRPSSLKENNTLRSHTSSQFCTPSMAPWYHSKGTYTLPEDNNQYYISVGNNMCLKEGIDFSHPYVSNGQMLKECSCKPGWFGAKCSIPASVKYSNYPTGKFAPTPIINRPVRRLINIFPFNMEFDMLEARFHELGNIVDAFVILESNYTAYGDSKALHLLERLKSGYYGHVSCKIIHVFLDYFPQGAKKIGWIAEDLNRNFIGRQGLAKQLLGMRDDDVIMLNDADELPSREVALFLKLHTGYPEPIGIYYSTNCYGFYWHNKNNFFQELTSVVTVKFVKEVLKYETMGIRKASSIVSGALLHKEPEPSKQCMTYKKSSSNKVHYWSFGSYKTQWQSQVTNSGWHCSYCLKPEMIVVKLNSAQNGDFPRWGDYPAKKDLNYIKKLIAEGKGFSDEKHLSPTKPLSRYYAPKYFMDNFEKFRYLLINPYAN